MEEERLGSVVCWKIIIALLFQSVMVTMQFWVIDYALRAL
jgi:hypothetical protein